ncbi:hypothetical protein [Flavobacterium sp.]|uniref:hypothetical protein n=1 Tax=Flavobacterium sp. TaxID=239 RepID=UPI002FDA241D
MKNSVLIVLVSLFSFSAFAQDLKYTEEKNPETSKLLAKVHAINAYGFKNHLIKTFVINNDLGYTKNEEPTGAKQCLYISDTEFGKETTTKLYKVADLYNMEVVGVVEVDSGYEITLDYGLNEDRIEDAFILKIAKK